MTIDRKVTNSVQRMKSSAPDSRTSAKSIGCLSVVVIVTVILLLVATDVSNMYKFAKHNVKV